jgi:hypothetical protein
MAIVVVVEDVIVAAAVLAGVPTHWQRKRTTEVLHDVEGDGGGASGWQPLNSLLVFLHAEIVEHLLERREGHRVREDGMEVFEVLVQPVQNI